MLTYFVLFGFTSLSLPVAVVTKDDLDHFQSLFQSSGMSSSILKVDSTKNSSKTNKISGI